MNPNTNPTLGGNAGFPSFGSAAPFGAPSSAGTEKITNTKY